MDIVIQKTGTIEFKSAALRKSAEKIAKEVMNAKRSAFVIGNELARIRDEKLYQKDFDTFEAFTETVFNMSKSKAYRLINVAVRLLAIPENEGNDFYRFSDSALMGLLPVGDYEEVKSFCEENEIDENTSARVIAQKVKVYLSEDEVAISDSDDGDGESEENGEKATKSKPAKSSDNDAISVEDFVADLHEAFGMNGVATRAEIAAILAEMDVFNVESEG